MLLTAPPYAEGAIYYIIRLPYNQPIQIYGKCQFDVCVPSYFEIREIWFSVAFEWRLSAAKFWCRAVNKSRQRTRESRKHRSFVAM
jgi:hypothetical protein